MKNTMIKSEKKIIKNNQIEDKILKVAKSEFLEKGFINASMGQLQKNQDLLQVCYIVDLQIRI